MNKLVVGADKSPILENISENFLIVDDGPIIEQFHLPKRRKITEFDISKNSFNPLRGMDHHKARNLASVFYAADPGGDDTLTVRNGKRSLAKLLIGATRLDKISGDMKDPAMAEALGLLESVLFSPVLKNVLLKPTSFSFKGTILVRLDRAKLGEFDCYVLANLLISQYPGTIIIPDFGFYQCPFHSELLRQDRLVAGINTFAEVPEFKQKLLQVEDKIASRCTPEDAEILAPYLTSHLPDTDGYDTYLKASIGGRAETR